MALKDKLSRIRKGAADERAPSSDAAQAPDVPAGGRLAGDPAPLAKTAAPAPAGGERFGGLKNVRVGDLGESDGASAGDYADEDIPLDSSPASRPAPRSDPEPAKTPGRFGAVARPQAERRVANPPSPSRSPAPEARRAPVQDLPQIQWGDPNRPAGSAYGEDEWIAAEEEGAQVVFEMVKPDERCLIAIPRSAMNGVEALLYTRSLVVSEDVEFVSQLPAHAQIVWRAPELGSREVMSYRVVRAEAEIQKNSWLQGSVLRNNLELAYQDAKAAQDEKSRFGNMPRQR